MSARATVPRRRPGAAFLALAAVLAGAPGCIAYTVVETAVDVAATTVGTAVDVTAGAVDLVIPDGDDDDD